MLPCHLKSYISASWSASEGPSDFDVSFVLHTTMSCTTLIEHADLVRNRVEFCEPTYPKCKAIYYTPYGVLSSVPQPKMASLLSTNTTTLAQLLVLV